LERLFTASESCAGVPLFFLARLRLNGGELRSLHDTDVSLVGLVSVSRISSEALLEPREVISIIFVFLLWPTGDSRSLFWFNFDCLRLSRIKLESVATSTLKEGFLLALRRLASTLIVSQELMGIVS
jgi:hypothetical protein